MVQARYQSHERSSVPSHTIRQYDPCRCLLNQTGAEHEKHEKDWGYAIMLFQTSSSSLPAFCEVSRRYSSSCCRWCFGRSTLQLPTLSLLLYLLYSQQNTVELRHVHHIIVLAPSAPRLPWRIVCMQLPLVDLSRGSSKHTVIGF